MRMSIIEELGSMCRNAIRLEIGGRAEPVTGRTRFGGVPDVPKGFEWPMFVTDTYDDGEVRPRPLAFLAQFDCGELSAFDKEGLLPKTGLLSFFYELESMRWGFDPKDGGCCRVFWFEDVHGLSPARVPDSLGGDYRFPALGIAAQTANSYPGYEDFSVNREFDMGGWDAFKEVCGQLGTAETESYSKLLGWPDVIQNNMTTECELVARGYYLGNTWEDIPKAEVEEAKQTSPEEWRLLFQLNTVERGDFELMLGDCGSIYFYIRKEDLADRRFDRVWLILQCC